MNDEKWQLLIEQVKAKFGDVSLHTEDLLVETADGVVKQGTEDILEFENDIGRFQIARENKPVLLDKKMHFSHRQGDSARTEYVFSENELSHKLVIYKEDQNGEWRKLDADAADFLRG